MKVRGFRIELDEITSVLLAQPGVATAAVVVRTLGELEELVAFVVPATGLALVAPELRRALGGRLPPYMVPAHFEFQPDLPRLTSGKIDINALRKLALSPPATDGETAAPRSEDEAALYAALKKLVPGRGLRPEADFFDDLGGHSLLTTRLVSILRADARYSGLSVGEIYQERRLGSIAVAMERQRLCARTTEQMPARVETPAWRRILCGAAQAAAIPFFILLHMADWLAPFFVYQFFTGDETDSIPRAVAYALGAFVLAQAANFIVAVAGKRLLTGRLKPGRYPLWGATYFRWWLAARFCELPDVYQLAGTAWMPLYLRALGARVGRDVTIDTVTVGAPELLTVEDGASIGTFVNIENARVEGGMLILGRATLERDAVVDSYSVLEDSTLVGPGARLCGLSALATGRSIPAGETWDGAPAARTERTGTALPPRPAASFKRRWIMAVSCVAAAMAVSILFFLPTFPAFMLIDWLDAHTWDIFDSDIPPLLAFGIFFLLAVPASTLLLGLTVLLTSGLRRMLLRQSPGISSVHSLNYWRKRVVTLVLDNSLNVLHGIYASVFAPWWLRSLGARVGKHSEVSTAAGMVPELLTLGDDSFVADGAMLGDDEVRGGWMILKPTRIGRRSFVGNGAYVPDGADIPEDVLIGVQTRSPGNERLKSGQTWLGSPPLLLPAREQIAGFPEALTFRPSVGRRMARGCIELVRIVLPLAMVIAAGYFIVVLVVPLANEDEWALKTCGALALAGCLYGVASFLLVVALKWILVGRYRPRSAPMWTVFVWTSEAVTNLYESLAVPNCLDILRGTPFLPWALRLLGARIGRGAYLNTTDLTEFDCVSIGDGAELNAWCGPQTHLFEDRIMKIGEVKIGARATVGTRSTILYDAQVGRRCATGAIDAGGEGRKSAARKPLGGHASQTRTRDMNGFHQWPEIPPRPARGEVVVVRVPAPDTAADLRNVLREILRAWSGGRAEEPPVCETPRGPVWHGHLEGDSLGISLSHLDHEGWIGILRGGRIGMDAVKVEDFPEMSSVAVLLGSCG